jgi:Cytochrome P450
MRWDAPVPHSTFRFAAEDVPIGDVVIPAYAQVIVSLAAANRDPARYRDPEAFDIARTDGGHLALGHGIHHGLRRIRLRHRSRVSASDSGWPNSSGRRTRPTTSCMPSARLSVTPANTPSSMRQMQFVSTTRSSRWPVCAGTGRTTNARLVSPSATTASGSHPTSLGVTAGTASPPCRLSSTLSVSRPTTPGRPSSCCAASQRFGRYGPSPTIRRSRPWGRSRHCRREQAGPSSCRATCRRSLRWPG